MVDIYNRLPTDLNYQLQLETNDDIENILAQVKMILGTEPTDVLGDPYFGTNINKYIFLMDYNQEEISQMVKESVLLNIDYDPNKYVVDLTVDFGHDITNGSDYACINVTINQIRYLGVIVNQ